MSKKFEKYLANHFEKRGLELDLYSAEYSAINFFMDGKQFLSKGIRHHNEQFISDILNQHQSISYSDITRSILEYYNGVNKVLNNDEYVYHSTIQNNNGNRSKIELHYKSNFDSIFDIDKLVFVHFIKYNKTFNHVINFKNNNHYFNKQKCMGTNRYKQIEDHEKILFIHGKDNYKMAMFDFMKFYQNEFEALEYSFDPKDPSTLESMYNLLEMTFI